MRSFASPLRTVLRTALLLPLMVACSSAPHETLLIQSVDLAFLPNKVHVAKAGRYLVKLVNNGKLLHGIKFANGQEIMAQVGKADSAMIDIPSDGLIFFCSIPGHPESGMRGAIAVGSADLAITTFSGGTVQQGAAKAPQASARLASASGMSHMAPVSNASSPSSASNTVNTSTIEPDSNAAPYATYDATAPARSPGSMHKLEIAVDEKLMTVAKGFVQRVWTFNGTVPGPILRIRVGDTVRVHFKNLASNKLPHSLDFHASEVAWNDQMVTINPGEERDFQWVAEYAGVYMYHCITAPPVHHVASGMFGVMIVEPRHGLPKVDKEFAIVQNEWYLGPQRDNVSLTKAFSSSPAPDFMSFNGVADQYADHPLLVKSGDRVRVFFLNVGPNLESSFHVVGMIFNTVIKEGVSLLANNPDHYGSQAVDLAPAQGAIIEFVAPGDGLYPFVTHTFNFHDRGAHGVFQVGSGVPPKSRTIALAQPVDHPARRIKQQR